jgi:ArsR family transcriptional regulator
MNMRQEHQDAASVLKALGHPIRFCIAEGLVAAERDVSTMVHCLEEPQPKISQHLNVLKAAGIIEAHREGARMVYAIKNNMARKVVEAIGTTRTSEQTAAIT